MLDRSSLLLVAGILSVALIVGVLLVSPQVRAGPTPPVTVLDAAALRDRGRDIQLVVQDVGGERFVEPHAATGSATPTVFAASSDGASLALSTVGQGQMGPLTLAHADGTQLEIAIPGVRGAAFEQSGAWLAVVDLAGVMWRVEPATGESVRVADGPFGSDLTVLPDGRVLAIQLSSMEAPIWAAAQLVDTASGAIEQVSKAIAPQDQLVYEASTLLDRAVALVRHRADGGLSIVRVSPDGSEARLTDLDRGTTVEVSPDGERLAWADGGRIWLKPIGTGPPPRSIGPGSAARFSPDGSLLMLFGGEATAVVDASGKHVADAESSACWLGDGRGCRP